MALVWHCTHHSPMRPGQGAGAHTAPPDPPKLWVLRGAYDSTLGAGVGVSESYFGCHGEFRSPPWVPWGRSEAHFSAGKGQGGLRTQLWAPWWELGTLPWVL